MRAVGWLVVLATAACLRPSTRTVTPVTLRAAVLGFDVDTLAPDRRAAVERGELWVGATAVEAYLARGRPVLWWRTPTAHGACDVLAHASLGDPAVADTAVTVCGGVVAQVAPIAPSLPCWRLAEVGPRVVAEAAYFDELPGEQQWLLIAGILRRGQSARDVAIAFGLPYSRGVDEREDGTRADQQAFLDSSGDAYGLRVTFIRDRVAGWRLPPERTLTPEAEQRRLEAMEQRLTERLKEMDARSRRQHAATVALFQSVMDRQDAMMAELTRPVPAPTPQPPPSSSSSGGASSGGASSGGVSSLPPSGGGGGITVTHTRVEIPWGRACREGGDDCRPGACMRLTDQAEPTCTRLCHSDAECGGGYRCGFETAFVAGHAVQRGMQMCRPRG